MNRRTFLRNAIAAAAAYALAPFAGKAEAEPALPKSATLEFSGVKGMPDMTATVYVTSYTFSDGPEGVRLDGIKFSTNSGKTWHAVEPRFSGPGPWTV